MMGSGPPPSLSKRVFNKYDTDGSGAIGPLELQQLVRELGQYEMDAMEIALAVAILDSDGSGQVELAAGESATRPESSSPSPLSNPIRQRGCQQNDGTARDCRSSTASSRRGGRTSGGSSSCS